MYYVQQYDKKHALLNLNQVRQKKRKRYYIVKIYIKDMSRTIRFRGKRVNGDGWVEGDLIQGEGKKYIFYGLPLQLEVEDDFSLNNFEVVPESVGQFVGFLDDKLTEVYENDLILYKGAVGKVVYDDNMGLFMVRFPLLRNCYSFDSMDESFTIIGNYNDNAELLK